MAESRTVIVLVQNPAYLAQTVKEGLDHAIEGLGMQIWLETLRRPQMVRNLNMALAHELGELLGQTFQSLPFFPFYPYMPSSKPLVCLNGATEPSTSKHSKSRGSKNSGQTQTQSDSNLELLRQSNKEMEQILASLGEYLLEIHTLEKL